MIALSISNSGVEPYTTDEFPLSGAWLVHIGAWSILSQFCISRVPGTPANVGDRRVQRTLCIHVGEFRFSLERDRIPELIHDVLKTSSRSMASRENRYGKLDGRF